MRADGALAVIPVLAEPCRVDRACPRNPKAVSRIQTPSGGECRGKSREDSPSEVANPSFSSVCLVEPPHPGPGDALAVADRLQPIGGSVQSCTSRILEKLPRRHSENVRGRS